MASVASATSTVANLLHRRLLLAYVSAQPLAWTWSGQTSFGALAAALQTREAETAAAQRRKQTFCAVAAQRMPCAGKWSPDVAALFAASLQALQAAASAPRS